MLKKDLVLENFIEFSLIACLALVRNKVKIVFKEVNRTPKFRAQNARANVNEDAKANICSIKY